MQYEILQFDPTRPLTPGTVYGAGGAPPASEPIPYIFDGERLTPHEGSATEPMPDDGYRMLGEERRTREEREQVEQAAQYEAERLAHEAQRLGFVDDERKPTASTVEAFTGTSIFWPTKLLVAGWDGDGKSVTALDLGFSLSAGAPFLGAFENQLAPMRVLFIQTEVADAEMDRRVKALILSAGTSTPATT